MNDESKPSNSYAAAPKFYANNSQFELSAWDLKIAFAQLDQSEGQPSADWRAVVTIPWAQAKVLAYYLQMNIAIFEHEYGPIAVPASVIPLGLEAGAGEANLQPGLARTSRRLHKQLFGSESQED